MFVPGDGVLVRGEEWIVEDVTRFDGCVLLGLGGTGRKNQPRSCHLIVPFDRPVRRHSPLVLHPVARRYWLRHLKDLVARSRSVTGLRTLHRAAIDILPFQLEPALAAVRGQASRFLLADEVGLGKTIQVGLMLAELRERGLAKRTLILTPAGLRRQWAEELEQRFHIKAAVFDSGSLRALHGALPRRVNPWAIEQVAITSIDFLKQPALTIGALDVRWDILIVDEAHHASIGSARYKVVELLGNRARHLILVTATPHSGDEDAFHALCALGRADVEPVALFRRTRAQVGRPGLRRVHVLRVHLGPASAEMHRRLDDYVRRLWNATNCPQHARLIAMVLTRRAFSSALSLARSIERRIAGLLNQRRDLHQEALPFEIDDDRADIEELPVSACFERPSDEIAMLRAVLAVAVEATSNDPKVRLLARFFARVHEPAIVFTEYRDTLERVADALRPCRRIVLLHGGLDEAERKEAVAAFAAGRADVLLATDAGSEGLNLHNRCRLVVNLELPWSPVRLEQRIGRVDRIGQARTVHAIHLVASETAESTVLAKLHSRVERIRASEIDIASCVINRSDLKNLSQPERRPDTSTVKLDLRRDAEREAARISQMHKSEAEGAIGSSLLVPVCLLRNAFASLPRHTWIWLVKLRFVNGNGRLAEEMLLPLVLPDAADPSRGVRHLLHDAETVVRLRWPTVAERAKLLAREKAQALSFLAAASANSAIRREAYLRNVSGGDGGELFQAGLFDNRAIERHVSASSQRREMACDSDAHIEFLQAECDVSRALEPQLVMLLRTC